MTREAVAAEPSAAWVINAKIRRPPLGEGWVSRPRPEALLADAVESRRVVVVSATAGSGKTTLVAAVAPALDRPVAWLTLDWTDTAPGRLVSYLEAALAVAVPRAHGVARDALTARLPHAEAAGLLVDAVAGERVVLVIDELERLGEEPEAWAIIEALLRHAPGDMRFVLCSRRPVPASILPRRPGEVTRLGDEALALTVEEAAGILEALDRPPVDPAAVVEATGGWITGVVFEAWRFTEQGDGRGDPLYSYLSAHIVGALADADREFLITTSVLREVTAARATALGIPDAGAHLARLRGEHIPVTWTDGGRTLRCHPRFREYLQHELDGWPAERLRALHVAHGRLLASGGRPDEATEVLLRAGAAAEALEPAATAIFDVINRLDFALAQRWLDELAAVEPEGMSPLVMARLTLAVATENPLLAVELADRLAASGKLEEVASSSSAAAWMFSVCFVHVGRYDDMLAAFAMAPHDADYEALRAFMGIYGREPDPPAPVLTGGQFDSVLLPIIAGYGHIAKVLEISGTVGWMEAYSQPWLIATLLNSGRTQEALELYEAVRARGLTNISLDASVGPRVLADLGRRDEALEAIRRGRERARETSALVYESLAGVEEAHVRLRLDRDPAGALAALDPVDRHPATHRITFLGPQVDYWYGFALLLAGRDAEALERLRRAVAVLRRTRQMLYAAEAAVYLAEAEWRMGNEEAADEAADLALEAAGVHGFNHMLLSALRDFPAVLARRLDAEASSDSPWHELGRALRAQGLVADAPASISVRLLEYGRCATVVDGEEVRPRIAKTYELLAFLLTRPGRRAERDELLDALFAGRADDSTRAYLRQAVRWLRSVLPADGVVTEQGAVALSGDLAAVSESVQLEARLAEAARLRGVERLEATLAALDVVARGPYLPGMASDWVEERRRRLSALATDARFEAAELAFAHGRMEEAERLSDVVLATEPYHEGAWRLTMRLAGARGDEQGVLRLFHRCEQVLAQVGAEPSATTRQLVDQLRR